MIIKIYILMKFLALSVSLFILIMPFANACKDIIVTNSMTSGDYNLLMKVRDPSRPGLQVLFIANKGYEYTYHHPWKNEPWIFHLNHKIIGVATKGDTPPNMIKAGMLMSDAGIAYGDADSPTLYINPTRNAWDDFDWLLYAAENASNADEAIQRLKEAEEMHAAGVGENLFVVDHAKAYVAEGDAFHFVYRAVNGIEIMSNYPKALWEKRAFKKAIASSFDAIYDGYVRKWQIVRLGGVLGVRIVKIGDNWIMAKEFPFGKKVKIDEGEGQKVGDFWVELIKSEGKRAKVRICYEYYEWENMIKSMLNSSIDAMDLMRIARLTSDDLHGLRGMAEGEEKATMIFKIPATNYDILTMGWFAPDAIASIFIPVHIADYDIYDAYENGEAAQIALNIVQKYGKIDFSKIEKVFVNENDAIERLAVKRNNVASILTASDTSMQKQAVLIEKFCLGASDDEINKFTSLWEDSYYKTLCNMEKDLKKMPKNVKNVAINVALEMCNARVKIEKMANGSDYTYQYKKAKELAEKGKYGQSLNIIKNIFANTDESLFGIKHERKEQDYTTVIALMLIAVLFLLMIYVKRRG